METDARFAEAPFVCALAATEEPLKPTLETSVAAHIAAIVRVFRRRGVNQPRWWVCNHVLKPVAADAATIAHPTHMR